MNPFEVERLGWEEIRGLPIVGDPEIGTGRFRVVCGGMTQFTRVEKGDAVSPEQDREIEVEREEELVTA